MHARFVRWTVVLAALASLFFIARAEGGGGWTGDGVADGATLFKSRSCSECHRLNGVGGGLGPDLSRVGDRLSREAIDALLARPRSINPLAVMPNPALLPPERAELARFLAGLSSSEVASRGQETHGAP
jgi:mono/diheme cytochrome c family protein